MIALPVALLLTVAGSVVAFPTALDAAEPFYIELLADGREAFEEGEFERAKKYLPLACFGLLEDPELLAQGLTYLSLARKAVDFDQTDLLLTLERLIDIEDRFGAYGRADLGEGVREQIEVLLAEKIPPERLFSIPVFADLARAELQRRVQRMPLEARAQSLELHLAAEPDEPGWLALAAELELLNGNAETALEHLHGILGDQTIGDDPSLGIAACMRGRALADLRRCEEAMDDLYYCGAPGQDLALIEPILSCHIQLRDWQKADELVSSLSKPLRKNDVLKPLIAQIRRNL